MMFGWLFKMGTLRVFSVWLFQGSHGVLWYDIWVAVWNGRAGWICWDVVLGRSGEEFCGTL